MIYFKTSSSHSSAISHPLVTRNARVKSPEMEFLVGIAAVGKLFPQRTLPNYHSANALASSGAAKSMRYSGNN
jgi:hypothetical protein